MLLLCVNEWCKLQVVRKDQDLSTGLPLHIKGALEAGLIKVVVACYAARRRRRKIGFYHHGKVFSEGNSSFRALISQNFRACGANPHLAP